MRVRFAAVLAAVSGGEALAQPAQLAMAQRDAVARLNALSIEELAEVE